MEQFKYLKLPTLTRRKGKKAMYIPRRIHKFFTITVEYTVISIVFAVAVFTLSLIIASILWGLMSIGS